MKFLIKSLACACMILLMCQQSLALELPPLEETHRDGGLHVVVVPDTTLPYMSLTFVVPVGSVQDPKGKEGLAMATAELLSYGTGDLDQRQVAEVIDGFGGQFSAWSDHEVFGVSGSIPTLEPEARDGFLRLYLDLLTRPSLKADSLAKFKETYLGKLRAVLDNNSSVADIGSDRFGLEGHRLGRPVSGTLKSIEALTEADVQDFHRRYVIPQHGWLLVGGNVTLSQINALLDNHPGVESWESDKGRTCMEAFDLVGWCSAFCVDGDCTNNHRLGMEPPFQHKKLRVLLLDKNEPGLNQVQFRVGFPLRRVIGAPDWFDYRVGVHTLGGGFVARINRVLRVEQGLTYGAYISSDYQMPFPGTSVLSTFTRTGDLIRALDLAFAEMFDFPSKPLPEEELRVVKDMINNKRAFLFEKIDGVIAQLYLMKMYRLGADFLREYEPRIEKVSSEEAQNAVGEVFEKSQGYVVVVGNADLAETLKAWAEKQGGSFEMRPAQSIIEP